MNQKTKSIDMKHIKFIIILLLAVIVFSNYSCNKQESFQSAEELVASVAVNLETITIDQLKAKMDSFEMYNLIDVREPKEHNHGYIPGAVNIPRGTLEFNIGKEEFWEKAGFYFPAKDEEFILFCKKGNRSILAVDALLKLGYTNVKYIEGGFKKWELTYPLLQEKNLELESHGNEEEVGGC